MKFAQPLRPALIALASIAAAPALAAQQADLAAIDAQVAGFVMHSAGSGSATAPAPVDRRLRLSACPMPLSLGWFGKLRESVLVQCPVAGGWRLFVPVRNPQGAVSGRDSLRDIARGDAVTIIVRGDNFRLTDRGTAMDAGAAGDWIEVRPARKDARLLQARIVRAGVVELQMP